MKLLPGNNVAEEILNSLKQTIDRDGLLLTFAAVLVGDDPASHIYVNLKEKASEKVGIAFQKILLPKDVSQKELLQKIQELNSDDSVQGILVQLPLPSHLNAQDIIDAIDPKKDVDGFHPENIRLFLEEKEQIFPVFPKAILKLILSSRKDVKGLSACVVVNSELFGRMMVQALKRIGVSGEYVLHQNIAQQKSELLNADIIISACGIPNFVSKEMIKPGVIMIDGGIAEIDGKVVGDADVKSMEDADIFLSPVPGGVGPVTIACLLENVYKASLRLSRSR